ncbi:uncharacterized protein J3R85_009171, partial [Psidium guajava]
PIDAIWLDRRFEAWREM